MTPVAVAHVSVKSPSSSKPFSLPPSRGWLVAQSQDGSGAKGGRARERDGTLAGMAGRLLLSLHCVALACRGCGML